MALYTIALSRVGIIEPIFLYLIRQTRCYLTTCGLLSMIIAPYLESIGPLPLNNLHWRRLEKPIKFSWPLVNPDPCP